MLIDLQCMRSIQKHYVHTLRDRRSISKLEGPLLCGYDTVLAICLTIDKIIMKRTLQIGEIPSSLGRHVVSILNSSSRHLLIIHCSYVHVAVHSTIDFRSFCAEVCHTIKCDCHSRM